jgi:hypothetical protein
MHIQTLRSFVKTALALQLDGGNDTPPGYREVLAAVHNRYLKLASAGRHAWEIGHLGVLGAPAAAELAGAHVSDKKKQVAEVVGLGGLATPYIHDLAMKNKRYAGSGIGRAAGKLFGHGL